MIVWALWQYIRGLIIGVKGNHPPQVTPTPPTVPPETYGEDWG